MGNSFKAYLSRLIYKKRRGKAHTGTVILGKMLYIFCLYEHLSNVKILNDNHNMSNK